FVPYSPLGRGSLTGTITRRSDLIEGDARASRYPRFLEENLNRNLPIIDRLTAIADRRQIKPGQLTLAWVLVKGKDIVSIPGTKRRKYLEENAAAASIQLTVDEVAEI